MRALVIFAFCGLGLSQQEVSDVSGFDPIPQGCSCAETTEILNQDCKYFDCGCACDLTTLSCDPNCCCDNDCTKEQITRFKANSACSDEKNDFADKCFSSASIETINFPDDNSISSSSRSDAAELLCVAVDNSAYNGRFYSAEKNSLSTSEMSELAESQGYSYEEKETTVSEIYDESFDIGSTIPFGNAFIGSMQSDDSEEETTANVRSNSRGLLQLPSSDFSAKCNNANSVRFMSGLPSSSSSSSTSRQGIDGMTSTSSSSSFYSSTTCTKDLDIELDSMEEVLQSIESFCQYELSVQASIPDLAIPGSLTIIGTSPSPAFDYFGVGSSDIQSTPATIAINYEIPTVASLADDFVAVRMNSVTYRNLSGVYYGSSSSEFNCLSGISLASWDNFTITPWLNDSAASGQWPVLNETCRPTLVQLSNSTYMCKNAVLDVSLDIYYLEADGGFRIADAESNLVLTDILFSIVDNDSDVMVKMQPYPYSSLTGSSLTQSFYVNFKSLPLSNEEPLLQRSGNPGYIFGSSILSGSIHTPSSTVNATNQGWLMPAYDADGSCVATDASLALSHDELITSMYAEESAHIGSVQFQSQSTQGTSFGNGLRMFRYSPSSSIAMLMPIKFGIDMKTSCKVQMSLDEFTEYCEGESDWSLRNSQTQAGVPVFFPLGFTHVGAYGNSNPDESRQWVQISQLFDTYPGASNTVNSRIKSCSSSLSPFTSMTIRFFTQRTGRKDNEQFKIVGSQVVYGYRQSTVSSSYHTIFVDNGKNQTDVTFDTIVNFIDIDQLSTDNPVSYFTPPSSSSADWLKLPKNSFYPFEASSAVPTSRSCWMSLAALAMFFHMN